MSRTTQLLTLWRDGDDSSRDELLALHLERVHQIARSRLGPNLRQRLESLDIAQEAFVRFLESGPRVVPANGKQFRALMARVIENTIRDTDKWYQAKKRELYRDVELKEELCLDLSRSRRPDEILSDAETRAAIRLGYDLMNPLHRQIHISHLADGKTFVAIGQELGMSEDAVRKRFGRASQELQQFLTSVRLGEVDAFLDDGRQADGEGTS